jgi:hypothetical protein
MRLLIGFKLRPSAFFKFCPESLICVSILEGRAHSGSRECIKKGLQRHGIISGILEEKTS